MTPDHLQRYNCCCLEVSVRDIVLQAFKHTQRVLQHPVARVSRQAFGVDSERTGQEVHIERQNRVEVCVSYLVASPLLSAQVVYKPTKWSLV